MIIRRASYPKHNAFSSCCLAPVYQFYGTEHEGGHGGRERTYTDHYECGKCSSHCTYFSTEVVFRMMVLEMPKGMRNRVLEKLHAKR